MGSAPAWGPEEARACFSLTASLLQFLEGGRRGHVLLLTELTLHPPAHLPSPLLGSEGITRIPAASPRVPSGPPRRLVSLGRLLGFQPLIMKWFHTDLQKKTEEKKKKNPQPFWTWALMHNIITEPAVHPIPLSPGQASLRQAWLLLLTGGRIKPLFGLAAGI